jgi:hypothetical protein
MMEGSHKIELFIPNYITWEVVQDLVFAAIGFSSCITGNEGEHVQAMIDAASNIPVNGIDSKGDLIR